MICMIIVSENVKGCALQLEEFEGMIGHFHVQTNKVDPGPAFQWNYVANQAARYMNPTKPCPS